MVSNSLVKEDTVQRLFRTCVLASCVSVVSLVVLSNTPLALTTRGYCVVLFTVPFTGRTFQFPNWMWGPIPMSVCAVSTLAAVFLWTALLVRRVRLRSASVSKT
jgi:hypothetical protein